ncbi:hypothetical protein [Rhodopirellula bahusiensis]|uniref:Uncharacterized protein n=1 Tax=Rhodopirellula bahusiensis TaxID=2014065 RepID=A0A2G1W4Q9_9BACT|nr:hypothetical protein [Rhodopirellula bahusiensis]PHQ33995.1 hypothetical protein CEE69_16960 [Rhodopirellula bahusiensis]
MGDTVQTPAYVSLIHSDFVQLGGDIESKREALDDLGLLRTGSCWRIPFAQSNSNAFEDQTLIDLVSHLRLQGIAFGEDFKQLCAPATYMQELQSRGTFNGDFDSIAFRGPNDWIITTVS